MMILKVTSLLEGQKIDTKKTCNITRLLQPSIPSWHITNYKKLKWDKNSKSSHKEKDQNALASKPGMARPTLGSGETQGGSCQTRGVGAWAVRIGAGELRQTASWLLRLFIFSLPRFFSLSSEIRPPNTTSGGKPEKPTKPNLKTHF